jgi:hypothetical protein
MRLPAVVQLSMRFWADDRNATTAEKFQFIISQLSALTDLGISHHRDGRDSRFADAGGIAERVAFCRYN